jgi:hypothetical protein
MQNLSCNQNLSMAQRKRKSDIWTVTWRGSDEQLHSATVETDFLFSLWLAQVLVATLIWHDDRWWHVLHNHIFCYFFTNIFKCFFACASTLSLLRDGMRHREKTKSSSRSAATEQHQVMNAPNRAQVGAPMRRVAICLPGRLRLGMIGTPAIAIPSPASARSRQALGLTPDLWSG